MDRQQELFTELFLALRDKGYDVYDGLMPPDDTPYPFVYLADSQETDGSTKADTIGDMYQTVHVWGTHRQRGTVSAIMADIKDISRSFEGEHPWILAHAEQRMMIDETTRSPLYHGILELRFKFS